MRSPKGYDGVVGPTCDCCIACLLPPAGRPGVAPAALAGFNEWVARGKVRYLRVSEVSQADVLVQLVPGHFLSADTKVTGFTTVCSSSGVLKRASICLAEGAMTPQDLRATAAHELGDALGISGHSDNPDDLVYPVEIIHLEAPDETPPDEAHKR